MAKLYKWSVSKLKSYKDCPFKFYCNHVLKMYPTGNSKALTWGVGFHQCAEFFFDNFEFPSKEELLKYYSDHWVADQYIKGWNIAAKKGIPRWQFLGYETEFEEKEYYLIGKKMVEDFWDRHHQIKYLPFATELKFNLVLPTGDNITGLIDRVDLLNGYRILDYKTGKWQETPEKLKEDLQIGIYEWAFCKMYNLPYSAIEYCALYYVRDSSLVPINLVEIEIDRILDETSAIITKVASDHFPRAPRERWLCKHCDYKDTPCGSSE